MGGRLLIVEDDRDLARALAEQLSLHEDIAAEVAATGLEALDAVRDRHFDGLIVDIGLPGMDGRDLCRLVRREGFRRPVIMLTAADSEADQILALDAGANDYVTKPFSLGVLLARLRAHLRQHEFAEDAVLRIGPFSFSPGEKLLVDAEGQRVRLTEKETRLLKYLYRRRGRPASQERLLKDVWGYGANVETHTVETHVFQLRRKIGQDGAGDALIVTEKEGYRLAL